MMEFQQSKFSVMSLVEATPSDLITQGNTARLVRLNLKAKLNVSELPTPQ